MTASLEGIRVLDLSRILAGPWASQLLGDLGADVIKIERPGSGDETRNWGPPYAREKSGRVSGEAAYFLSANRGKRSVTLDFSREEGADILRRLAGESDVFLENFRVGTLARYGLSYEDLRRHNPRLVYCSISAYGQDGPRRDAPGYDAMIQAMGGLMSITGPAEGEEGSGPQKVGVAVADLFSGMYTVSAVLAALYAREQNGEGQHIDISLFDCQVAMLANQAMNYLTTGVAPGRLGTAHPNIVPYQAMATADGHLMLAVGSDGQFERLARVLGLPELCEDDRFGSNDARVAHRADLIPLLEQRFRSDTTATWIGRLEDQRVPCGAINDIARVFQDPQAEHRGLRLNIPHSLLGEVPLVANPIRLSATPVAYRRAPPLLGEHTAEVLEQLGMSAETIERLRATGII